ncbi:MAG: chorion class high-cysteine HCB protein 13 [Lachnospiraceae bacterium]|nr:chorion class high-cysteine HCB protein 13 [Lachnospiraceae bacterium]
MSDLTATNCGCGNMGRSGCGCSNIIWIILLLSLCGGNGNDDCGCNDNGLFGLGGNGGCECIIWILLLLSCGGCGNGLF